MYFPFEKKLKAFRIRAKISQEVMEVFRGKISRWG